MREFGEGAILIDERLRFVFFGLECALGVTLYPLETERVFRDARENQVSLKEYVFHESRGLRVIGRVHEYEPETLLLSVVGRGAKVLLPRIIEGAEWQFIRMQRALENESPAE